MATNFDNFSFRVKASPELTALISASSRGEEGADEALMNKIGEIARERGITLVDEEREKTEYSSPWKAIVIATSYLNILSYMWGYSRGHQKALNQLPENLAKKLIIELKKESNKSVNKWF